MENSVLWHKILHRQEPDLQSTGEVLYCRITPSDSFLDGCQKDQRKLEEQYRPSDPFSVVVLGMFRRFLLVIFLSLFLHLDFSFIYSKFSMPFWGFFY